MPDPNAVNSMFARIARRYDVANRLLSGGADVWWRRCLVRSVKATNPSCVLDLATGSGDVAFALANQLTPETKITGMDFCQPMLDEAIIKQQSAGKFENISFVQGDGMNLPLHEHTQDAVTISFGLRNMADRHTALTEMRRVLRPGGYVFVLEFSQPFRWFSPFYYAYLRYVLPILAALVTGNKGAYDYLCGSIETYPNHLQMAGELEKAGFKNVQCRRMTLGIVALHSGRRD